MNNKDYLFIYDTSGIKNYIFGTSKLKEIRGASAILDQLNRKTSTEIIKSYCNNLEIIYTNGGTGQFILKNIDESEIKKIIQDLCSKFSKETIQGINIFCGYEVLSSNYSNYQDALRKCYFMINNYKSRKFSNLNSGTLIGKNCDSFSESYSSLIIKNGDNELEYLSDFSQKKRITNTDHLWKEFMNTSWKDINYSDKMDSRPHSFKDVDNKDIGLIYADGNAMGKIIKSFTKPDQYKNFADIVDSSIREACYSTLKEIYSDYEKIKADILLLGGDDLVVVTSAKDAFIFAWKVAEKFNEITKTKLKERDSKLLNLTGGKGFTISVGVSIGSSNYPFRILIEQAEDLLSLAKKKGSASKSSNEYYADSYIDFHVNKQSNQVQVKQYRENNYDFEYKDKTYKRSLRPFSLEDCKKFSRSIISLQRDSEIGKTRIHMLKEAINETSFSKIQLNFMHVYGRTKNREKLENILNDFDCLHNAPWNNSNETIITDISDMIDLIRLDFNEA